MKNIKKHESELIKELKQRFGAEEEQYEPNNDELQLIEERSALENSEEIWTLEGYVKNYDRLVQFGLEEKQMENLQFHIEWSYRNWKKMFYRSEFYKQFKEHDVVKRIVNEKISNQLKNNMAETRDDVLYQQVKWAKENGIALDDNGYVKKMEDNFFEDLSADTVRDLKGGDGSEYPTSKGSITKIFATHSSSALVINFFEFWRLRHKDEMAAALKLQNGIKTFSFEQKLSMGMQGRKPNVDIFMILTDGQAVAVESKFTEWMNEKSSKKHFSDSYFNGKTRWTDVGLPNCQKLAESIDRGEVSFKYLDAPQLLKHALGLAYMHSNRSKLIYMYCDLYYTELGKKHEEEVQRFKEALNGELNFQSNTYQDFVLDLPAESFILGQRYSEYWRYIGNRYLFYKRERAEN